MRYAFVFYMLGMAAQALIVSFLTATGQIVPSAAQQLTAGVIFLIVAAVAYVMQNRRQAS